MRWSEDDLAILRARGSITEHRINPNPKPKPKPSKYRNRRTIIGTIAFDSRKEATRWENLLLLQKAGHISKLERQVRFPLKIKGDTIATYIADFRYLQNGKEVVEDVKGCITREYRLKARLMKALLGIEILET